MDFYALNATPIDGWETHLGSGAASMKVAGAAMGNVHVHPTGVVAAMQTHAQANGINAITASGAAVMQLLSEGIGYAIIHGFGRADGVLSASGDGMIIPFAGGHAHLVMSASGDGRVAALGVGYAAMRLMLDDAGVVAARGVGDASMVMTATYGIPDPIHVPTDYRPSHPKARMTVGFDDRHMMVPPDRWPVEVEAQRDIRMKGGARCLT